MENEYVAKFDTLLQKVDASLKNQTGILAAHERLLESATCHQEMLATQAHRLDELEKDREEWGTLAVCMQTRMAEADQLVTKAARAEALLAKHLNTAATSTETLTRILENQERITEELDIARRACRGIIFNVEEVGTCFEDTRKVFDEIGLVTPRTTTAQRRGNLERALATGKPRPIIVFLPSACDVIDLLKTFNSWAKHLLPNRPPFHIKKDQTYKQVAAGKEGALAALELCRRSLGDFRNCDGRVHLFKEGRFERVLTDIEVKTYFAQAVTAEDVAQPIPHSINSQPGYSPPLTTPLSQSASEKHHDAATCPPNYDHDTDMRQPGSQLEDP